jgi:hypothetical protein
VQAFFATNNKYACVLLLSIHRNAYLAPAHSPPPISERSGESHPLQCFAALDRHSMMPPAPPVAACFSHAICRRPRLCCLGGRSFSSDKINSRAQRIPLSRANRARLTRRSRTRRPRHTRVRRAKIYSPADGGPRCSLDFNLSSRSAARDILQPRLISRQAPTASKHKVTRTFGVRRLCRRLSPAARAAQSSAPLHTAPRQKTVIPSVSEGSAFYGPRTPTCPLAPESPRLRQGTPSAVPKRSPRASALL